VNDPETLAPRYLVELGSGLQKAMWVASSPDGRELYTSRGRDLLVFDAADVKAGTTTPVAATRVLVNVLPTTAITGGAVWRGRLYVATGHTGVTAPTTLRLWSIAIAETAAETGPPREEYVPRRGADAHELRGESEGLEVFGGLDGILHWSVAGFVREADHPFANVLLNLRPAGAPDMAVAITRQAADRWTVSAATPARRPRPARCP
jgi:hypothetical protein